jgi:hypothetical protein
MATHGLPAWPWTGSDAEALPSPERLLLDAARLWETEARAGRPPIPTLRLLLAAEDAPAALLPLDALLRAAPAQARDFGCALCPRVQPAEAALLLACALAQRGQRGEALAALLRWLPLGAAYAAMPAAIHLGCALRRAGMLLHQPLRVARRT